MLNIGHWIPVKDGDPRAVALYRRHYSARLKNHGIPIDYCRYGFSGQGESLLLLTIDCRALFGWKKEIRDDGQTGVNCFVFRNEGNLLSSNLILEAEQWAWLKWPGERLFTFVNAGKIRSANPGYCFLKAHWNKCGFSKGGLVILEKLPGVQKGLLDIPEAEKACH